MKHTHIGVYGIIILNNSLLLIKKRRGPYTNLFDLPGGRIEFGETPEQTLIREVAEETGLKVIKYELSFCNSVCFKHNVTNDNSMEELHHIGIVFKADVENGIGLKKDSDGYDSNGAFWLDLSNDNNVELTPFANMAIEKLKQIK